MELTERQLKIIEIVKKNEPITGEKIAAELGYTRSTLRPDFSLLTLGEFLIAKTKIGYFYNANKVEPFIAHHISQSKVEDVMSVPVIVEQTASVQDAIIKMFSEDAGSLFITDKDRLVGLVSRKDLLKTVLGKSNLEKIPVSMVMTKMPNIIYVKLGDTVELATKKLLSHEIDSLPVVVEDVESGGLLIVGKFSKTLISQLFFSIIENKI